jgi:hypothetical protein
LSVPTGRGSVDVIVNSGFTVKLTGMFCGVLAAPGAATWILPLYVPAVRLPTLTTAVIVPLLVPEVTPLRLRKAPLVTTADQLSVPTPVMLIPTV